MIGEYKTSVDSFFKVGARYENRIGPYKVLALATDSMRIRYESGNDAIIKDLAFQRRIVERLAQEKAPKPAPSRPPARSWHQEPMSPRGYYFTLGFLSIRARIEAHVPAKSQERFEAQYQLHTGEQLTPGKDKYYLHTHETVDKWGYDLRIQFNASPVEMSDLCFGPKVVVRQGVTEHERRINNSALILDLFSRGFRMGSKQYPQSILQRVPLLYVADFERGVQAALGDL